MQRTPKVFLVNPANGTFGYSFITPRWLFVIASATPAGLVGDPVVVDESVEKFDPGLVRPGDVVGIGITTGNCIAGYRVLRAAKKKGATVVMGGIHATIFPREPMEMGADAVVTGGGDVVWGKVIHDVLDHKLLKRYDGGKVPGDKLLPARWDLLDASKYMFPSVQTIAGCPENCSFCSVWVTEGRSPRQRLTDCIIDEVNTLSAMGFPFIIFADDNFNPATRGRIVREESASKRRALERSREERLLFFEEYAGRVKRRVLAFTQATSEIVSDPEYLQAMHDKMGIRAVLIGVESFTGGGLKSVRKQWNPVGQKMVQAIQTIQANGIFVLSSIICGLETDTRETIKTMRMFARKSGALLAQFTLYSPFPGTVDFREMMDDLERREAAAPGQLPITPKHRVQILHKEFWRDPQKPAVLIKHPNMDGPTLLTEIRKNWKSFYALSQVLRRALRQNWTFKGKIVYVLGSLGFKALYADYGLSADSVKGGRTTVVLRLSLKGAIRLYTRHLKKRTGSVRHAVQT